MKYSVFSLAIGISVFCVAPLMRAYPDQINIKNASNEELYFIADWQRETPKTTAEYWGSLGDRIEKTLPSQIGRLEETHLIQDGHVIKRQTYTFIKASPVDWQPIAKMVGQRRPVLSRLDFEQSYSGPIYLIYADAGFRVVSRAEWDELNQK